VANLSCCVSSRYVETHAVADSPTFSAFHSWEVLCHAYFWSSERSDTLLMLHSPAALRYAVIEVLVSDVYRPWLSIQSLYVYPLSVLLKLQCSVMQLWYHTNANFWGWAQKAFVDWVTEPKNILPRMHWSAEPGEMLATEPGICFLVLSLNLVGNAQADFMIALPQHALPTCRACPILELWGELVNQPKQMCTGRAPSLAR